MPVIFVEQFDTVLGLIRQAQQRALRAVNAELVDLYWRVGQYVSDKIAQAEWGDATVKELANHLRQKDQHYVALIAGTSIGCGNSMKLTNTMNLCQHC